jgi:site-specific DNA-methyltransferase (adenine-specific)
MVGRRFNIWRFIVGGGYGHSDSIAYKHSATFPENLAHDHIISWSNEGDVVYDPFLGSGTTAKVAKEMNRKYIGSEIHEDYFKIAQKRINQTQEYFF